MKNNIMVSVIVPLYNAEKFIRRCVSSIEKNYKNNVEIIIINDASTDRSIDAINELKKEYKNIILLNNSNNKGAGYSRNQGIKVAKGDFIQFVDADDELNDIDWESIVRECSDKEIEIAVFDSIRVINGNETNVSMLDEPIEDSLSGNDFFEIVMQKGRVKESACMYLINKEYIKKNKLLFSEGHINEDALFSLKMIVNANKIKYYYRKYGYRYYKNDNSVSTKEVIDFCTAGWINVYELLTLVFEDRENRLPKSIDKYINRIYMNTLSLTSKVDYKDIEKQLKSYNEDVFRLCSGLIPRKRTILDINKIKNGKPIIIFGIGIKGKEIACQLNNSDNVNFIGFAVSESYWNDPQRKDYLLGHPVKKIDEYKKYATEANIIITALSYKHNEIINELKEMGFSNFICE